jgi:DNA-directed RNA polymerase specialized sigma24 family protein
MLLMPSSEDIPPLIWEEARQALVFYFSRRYGAPNAEDLAQTTLTRILETSYQFEKVEDFPKVCYAFGRLVGLEFYRKETRQARGEMVPEPPAPGHDYGSARATNARIFLQEVIKVGKTQLPDEWELILQGSVADRAALAAAAGVSNSNNARVKLHRARKKLADMTGWKRK